MRLKRLMACSPQNDGESLSCSPAETDVALQLCGIWKKFEHNGRGIPILKDLSLSIRPGESVALTGPSGSGKTTLLHVAAGLEPPDEGWVRVAGQDPYALDERRRAAFRRCGIGMVFQQHHLLPQLTALENVLLPVLAESRNASGDDVAKARELLRTVELEPRATHRPAQLSGGERQRVALARALIHQPSVLLADEPTASLDRTTAHDVALLLSRLVRGTRTALLVATHDTELADLLDRTLLLKNGSVGEPA